MEQPKSNKTKFLILGVVVIIFCCLFSSISTSAGLILWPTGTESGDTQTTYTPPATTPPATTPPGDTQPSPVPSSQSPESSPSPTEFQSSLSPGCWKYASDPGIFKINAQGMPCHIKDPAQYRKICGPTWISHKTSTKERIMGSQIKADMPKCTDNS